MSIRGITSVKDITDLLSAQDYREFVARWIKIRSSSGKRFGYSDIARYAGFSSRSFPRDVVLGHKCLTARSLNKFVAGMGLTGDLARYFRTLVEREQPDCRSRVVSTHAVERALQNQRDRILRANRAYRDAQGARADSAFQIRTIPIIYAALGTTDAGASISEIKRRTGISKGEIMSAISAARRAGLLEERSDRYFAKASHLNLPGLKQSEIYQRFFLHLLDHAALNARKCFNSDRHLFFSSAFSVEERKLPKLKEALRTTLLEYVDTAEAPTGEKVVSIVCSLF